ncbi:MAG: hypothetical protein R2780_05005 [Crocinitomicaceae bacterium]|nr:hypothetical protein [Crocinitomicaceae bacterium]
MRSSLAILIFLFNYSCQNNPEVENVNESINDSISIENEQDMALTQTVSENIKFQNSTFEWYLNEREQNDGVLVTDIALEAQVNEFNSPDTVFFFTARGKWEIINDPESIFQNFPKGTEQTVYSQTESCFFSIVQNDDTTYEVLFGGIEQGKAFAIVEQGHIWVENSHIAFEIFLPEEVETYIEYGNDL